jgi:hypothetical protein
MIASEHLQEDRVPLRRVAPPRPGVEVRGVGAGGVAQRPTAVGHGRCQRCPQRRVQRRQVGRRHSAQR